MLYKQLVFIIICLFCASCFSCSRAQDIQEDPAFNGDTGSNTGSDSDTDTDTDTDSDTDTDTDTGSDTGLKIVENCTDGWCSIPAGVFTFGAFDSEPCDSPYADKQFKVTLTRPFIIQQTEVTQAQWEAAGFPNPAKNTIGPQYPVFFTNYYEAMAYANALSTAKGLDTCYELSKCLGKVGSGCPDGDYYEYGCRKIQGTDEYLPELFRCEGDVHKYKDWYACPGYRLPTGAEWEYAARAGSKTSTFNGDLIKTDQQLCDQPELDKIMWCVGNTTTAQPVAQKMKNGWGLYDVQGNIAEYTDYPFIGLALDVTVNQSPPIIDPQGPGDSTFKDQRGGSYRTIPCFSRLGSQGDPFQGVRGDDYGIRLVKTVFDSAK